MHVGWATTFSPPPDRPRPDFAALFEHVRGRLSRDARFRQRLAPTPLRMNAPCGSTTTSDPERHIVGDLFDARRSWTTACRASWSAIARSGSCASPTALTTGGSGSWKAHHCMVDGIAAVELAALLGPHA